MPPAPIIWFADDWGRHPSSSQHLARRLLLRRSIHWVNTIGTRKPRLDRESFRRGFEKLRHWSRRANDDLPTNLTVSSPRMWPWFTRRHDRWLNRLLLSRHLKRVLEEPPVIVTTLPLTADLIGRVPAARWVYYCVDDFSAWPGLDRATLLAMERQLVAKADRIIAVSETLQERLKSMGRTAELLTHGVDLEFWRVLSVDEAASFVFWGVIDRRMDVDIIRALTEVGRVMLVGPRNDPAPALLALPNVEFLPPQPLEALRELARQAAVLIMPYADLPVTRAMQPLKLKEYLATGRPCVVRDLPANREWADCLDVADTPASFAAAVKRRLDEGVPETQRLARERLRHESWDDKALLFERMIDD